MGSSEAGGHREKITLREALAMERRTLGSAATILLRFERDLRERSPEAAREVGVAVAELSCLRDRARRGIEGLVRRAAPPPSGPRKAS